MSNILNHNRLPFECKLSRKDYWDFCIAIRREASANLLIDDSCVAAYIDTTLDDCVTENGLVSIKTYEKAKYENVELEDFGLTGMDNGQIMFNRDISDEDFKNLYFNSTLSLPEQEGRLVLKPVNGNLGKYSYGQESPQQNGFLKLYGGFYQGMFRSGDGCKFSLLPSKIENGITLEFVLCLKNLPEYDESNTLNSVHCETHQGKENKGTFFYMGTRAENKWMRYYNDNCSDREPDKTNSKTKDGDGLDTITVGKTETGNRFITYNRNCIGYTTKKDKEKEPVAIIDTANTILPDNPFTIFSRTCGGTTVENFDEYEKEHAEGYNLYADLWRNAIAFKINEEDYSVGYRYLVKDCDSENPSCGYKIEEWYSKPNTIPYGEWCTIHVNIFPSNPGMMRLAFYVNGKLVLYSKELPMLNLRELADSSNKQETVPFNISIGGGTQGLAESVYEDWKTYNNETIYPLQCEFGGSFVGLFKSFKYYNCLLNYSQINTALKEYVLPKYSKIYCGTTVFNTKPSETPITDQLSLITNFAEYTDETRVFTINTEPNTAYRYVRYIVAVPSSINVSLQTATTTINGLGGGATNVITNLFGCQNDTILPTGDTYNIWYCTYASPTMYNNTITIEFENE